MKRAFCMWLTALALVLCFVFPVNAEENAYSGTCGDDAVWTFDTATGTLTVSGTGYMDGWSSRENPPWHPYRGMVKKVVLSGKIENIYSYAFQDCTQLTEVVWTPTITSIHDGAFRGCTSLTSITIPDTVKYIYNTVFYGCTALKSVKLSNSLVELSVAVFGKCTALKSVTVPASVTNLWSQVFTDSAVESVYFQGNMPGFSQSSGDGGSFSKMGAATVYYAENNRTWTADKIKAEQARYGGSINFVASEELNKYTQHQQFVTDPKPTTGSNIGNSGGTSPEIPETTPQTTAPTESTGTTPPEATQPETTQPVEPTDETTTPTVMEEHSASEKENSGAWIVWLVVGIVVVADTVIGVIYLKKRKKNQQ